MDGLDNYELCSICVANADMFTMLCMFWAIENFLQYWLHIILEYGSLYGCSNYLSLHYGFTLFCLCLTLSKHQLREVVCYSEHITGLHQQTEQKPIKEIAFNWRSILICEGCHNLAYIAVASAVSGMLSRSWNCWINLNVYFILLMFN